MPQIVGPGVTLASTGRDIFAGGKGLNQSVAAAKAGASVRHVGAIGPDGQLLLETMTAAGVDTSGVLQIDEPSGHAMIQVNDAGQNAIVIHGGANRTLTQAFIQAALDGLGPGQWVLLQNEINDLDQVIQAAALSPASVALNLAPADERISAYPIELLDLLIVNIAEGQALVEAKALGAASTAEDAFLCLAHAYPEIDLVMTLGDQGLLWHAAGSDQTGRMETIPVQPVDETAAGDSFVGYLLASLAQSGDLAEALAVGTVAGALAVTRAGAAPSVPDQTEVASRLKTPPVSHLSDFPQR